MTGPKKEMVRLTVILTVVAVGFILMILAAVVVVMLLRKGYRFLSKGKYRYYSSSHYRPHRPFWKYGHKSYGHHYYRRKYSSRSGFFSS